MTMATSIICDSYLVKTAPAQFGDNVEFATAEITSIM
jgi:hypothetical protein